MLILLALAHAAEPSSDVVASHVFAAPPQAVYDHLLDVRNVQEAAPETCMKKWIFYDRTEGLGAQFRVVYHIESWRRRLDASVVVAEKPRRIEWDHHGRRGFITRFTIAPESPGSKVTVHTYLSDPPWPFRKYYANKVQPAWEECYGQMLQNVAAVLGETGG